MYYVADFDIGKVHSLKKVTAIAVLGPILVLANFSSSELMAYPALGLQSIIDYWFALFRRANVDLFQRTVEAADSCTIVDADIRSLQKG